MSTIFTQHIPLEFVLQETKNYLKSVKSRNKYDNGDKTDEIDGYIYEVVNLERFDTLRVFVKGGKKPLITNEELLSMQEAGEKVYVEFDNAQIKPYYNTFSNQLEDSVKADSVRIVTEQE